jgi:hypothetical protein
MLPVYEKELSNFKKNLDSLESGVNSRESGVSSRNTAAPVSSLPSPDSRLSSPDSWFSLLSKVQGHYKLEKGQPVFPDTTLTIEALAPELQGLNAIQFSRKEQAAAGTTIKFSATRPVKILVGFFVNKPGSAANNASRLPTNDSRLLKEPELETDASANDYGQAETKIANALLLPGLPPINVHSYSFKPGEHILTLGKGICLILGVIDDNLPMHIYDARLNEPGKKDIDWLFDN